jgi:hypothetical protein
MREKIADGSLANAEGATLRDLGLGYARADEMHLERGTATPADRRRYLRRTLNQGPAAGTRARGDFGERRQAMEERRAEDRPGEIAQAFDDPKWSREASGGKYAEHEPGVPKTAEELTDYWLGALGEVRKMLSADVRAFLDAVAEVRAHQRRGEQIIRDAAGKAAARGTPRLAMMGIGFDDWPDLRRAVGVHDA